MGHMTGESLAAMLTDGADKQEVREILARRHTEMLLRQAEQR